MALVLLVIYIFVLLLMIVGFMKCLKVTLKWRTLFAFEIFSILSSFAICTYYDGLPGKGIMPGLSYTEEIFYSMVATILYSLFFFITVLGNCLSTRKK